MKIQRISKIFSLIFPLLTLSCPDPLLTQANKSELQGDREEEREGSCLYSYCLLSQSVEKGKGENSQNIFRKKNYNYLLHGILDPNVILKIFRITLFGIRIKA